MSNKQMMTAVTRMTEITYTIQRLNEFTLQMRNPNGFGHPDESTAMLDAEYLVELLDSTIMCPMRNRPKDYPALRITGVEKIQAATQRKELQLRF